MMVNDRLAALRAWMKDHDVDAVIVASGDPHQSEYVPRRYAAVGWISGFDGSAGTVVVTRTHAGLWTDGRYFLQAEDQLADSEVVLHKLLVSGDPEYLSYVCDELPQGSTVAMDGSVLSQSRYKRFSDRFSQHGIGLRYDLDPFETIWEDRPGLPSEPVYEHDLRYAGRTRSEKISDIRAEMTDYGASMHLIVPLDAVAWTLNLRGSDVDCNPVFISYLMVTRSEAHLFIDLSKISLALKEVLSADSVHLHDYSDLSSYLSTISEDETILLDPAYTSRKAWDALASHKVVKAGTIPMYHKAIKNDTEVQHFRDVMPKDGVAIYRTMRWLEQELQSRTVTEYELAQRLTYYRATMDHFVGESFHPIVGYKSNGAVIHYRAREHSSKDISADGMLLIDSGGQYLDGTTDITRTFHLSTPTDEEKKMYTLVLKGFIALAQARFPHGTRGIQLDMLARQYLWQDGKNFLHGTGHGVGFFMNVHEAPQGFANALSQRGTTAHVPGMVSSNEPGFYKDGAYGIRIENLIVCREDEDGFLSFEDLTVYPLEKKLIDCDLLSPGDIDYIDSYHKMCYEKMAPLCTEPERADLERACVAMAKWP